MAFNEINFTSGWLADWGDKLSTDANWNTYYAAVKLHLETYIKSNKHYLKVRLYSKTAVYKTSGNTDSAMQTTASGGYEQSALSLYLKVGENLFFNGWSGASNGKRYWVYSVDSSTWRSFPTLNPANGSGQVGNQTQTGFTIGYDSTVGAAYAEKVYEISSNSSETFSFDCRIISGSSFVGEQVWDDDQGKYVDSTGLVRFKACANTTYTSSGGTKSPGTAINGCRMTGSVSTTYYTSISAGSISITDNKDSTITISGKNAKKGTNNDLAESKLYYKFNNQNTETSINIGTTSESTISKTISIPENATSVTARLVSKGQQGDTATANANAGNSVSVKYRTKPSVANLKLSWESAHKKDNTARLKDDLTWNWSGVEAGINTPIEGYRIFVYKTTTGNLTTGESKYSYTDGKLVIDSSKSGTSLPLKDSASSISHIGGDKDDISTDVTDHKTRYLEITTDKTEGYFTFNPKDAGFENKDYCVFEIGARYSWGGTTAYSTWVTSEPSSQNCNCYFTNSASVWVKTKTNGWKEGTVWVKTKSGGWKEADSIWIKTKTGGWKEPS